MRLYLLLLGIVAGLWFMTTPDRSAAAGVTSRPSPTLEACHPCDEGLISTVPPSSRVAEAAQNNDAVVHAAMFWMSTCPHCHVVLEEVLPPLQQRYGDQLQILLIEVKSEQEWNWLVQTGTALGVPQEYLGVPFLIIGQRALMGSEQIPAELPGLIEQHLAAGGVELPDLPGLSQALAATATSTVQPTPSGFGLAIAILVGMVVALTYTGAVALQGFKRRPARPASAWPEVALPLLALIGLGVALYLAYVETQAVEAICGPVGDCNAVQASPYATLFGVLPVGVLGAAGYLAILAAWLWGRFGSGQLADYAPPAMFGLSLFGVLFSVYLTYLEPFVIGAVCIWCLTSAVIITLLMLLTLKPALWIVQKPAR